jgi:molybdopterin/thiamine biosynthesis adenylyltransferase
LILDFGRIEHLLSPAALQDKKVVQIGLGSGGAPVCDHLTMNGVRNWTLYDPETLEPVNLVKHPRGRSDLDKPKVEIQRDWILDRNPNATVVPRCEDVFESTTFRDDVSQSDLILCCPDKREVRSFINSIAVEFRKPCVTGSVFRQGIGGEVYAYIPGHTGCFACMERVASEQEWNINDTIQPTAREEEMIYGRSVRDFQASGLSMDIQMIALIQARLSLDLLLDPSARHFPPIPSNWIIFYNRPAPGSSLGGHFKTEHLRVRPRKDCQCATL